MPPCSPHDVALAGSRYLTVWTLLALIASRWTTPILDLLLLATLVLVHSTAMLLAARGTAVLDLGCVTLSAHGAVAWAAHIVVHVAPALLLYAHAISAPPPSRVATARVVLIVGAYFALARPRALYKDKVGMYLPPHRSAAIDALLALLVALLYAAARLQLRLRRC